MKNEQDMHRPRVLLAKWVSGHNVASAELSTLSEGACKSIGTERDSRPTNRVTASLPLVSREKPTKASGHMEIDMVSGVDAFEES
jgi:hypothetical protein